tara:strand:+ start:555 stop:719 length:165 start_codon:yes stop_codon:yes gene_type:complete
MSDYYESAKGIMITRDRALQEIRNHNLENFEEFFEDLGDREYYDAQSVLIWLGY